MRGQANLPALAVALLALTATVVLALAVGDHAFAQADRDPGQRRVGTALAERVVSADSPLTDRRNVLDAAALSSLDPTRLRAAFPVVGDHAVRIRVGNRSVVERGDASGGTSIRRIVLVRRRQTVEREPQLDDNETTLPRRTRRVGMDIDTPAPTTVRTVRANGRVVLHDPSGLDGEFEVRVSRFDTVTLTFETDSPLEPGTVELTYYPARTTKATMVVTVDG